MKEGIADLNVVTLEMILEWLMEHRDALVDYLANETPDRVEYARGRLKAINDLVAYLRALIAEKYDSVQ